MRSYLTYLWQQSKDLNSTLSMPIPRLCTWILSTFKYASLNAWSHVCFWFSVCLLDSSSTRYLPTLPQFVCLSFFLRSASDVYAAIVITHDDDESQRWRNLFLHIILIILFIDHSRVLWFDELIDDEKPRSMSHILIRIIFHCVDLFIPRIIGALSLTWVFVSPEDSLKVSRCILVTACLMVSVITVKTDDGVIFENRLSHIRVCLSFLPWHERKMRVEILI